GEDQGLNYIVFEYIEGANIRDLVVQRGPLPLEEAISYTLQLAEALDHAAQRDVVHRDIKPSNVLVMGSGHVKLVDMGLARLHQVEASNEDLTATGVTLGTFDYISPEQARDPRSADVRSDLYSLGCTLYFMLAGRPPFPEGTVLQKLLSHSSDPPPDVRTFRPELPEEVSGILGKLLAKQPAQRFQEPSELIGALLLLADRAGLDRVSKSGKVWIATHETGWNVVERQLPWVVPILLLILVVAWLQWSRRGPADVAARPARPVYPSAPGPAVTRQPTALPLNRPDARERDGAGDAGAGTARGRSTSDRDGNRFNPESGMNRSDDGSRETGERNEPSRGDSGRTDSSRDESGRGDGLRGDGARGDMSRADMNRSEPNRPESIRGSDGERGPTEAAAVEVRDGGSTAPSGGTAAGSTNSPASATSGASSGNSNSPPPMSTTPGISSPAVGSTFPPMTFQPMSLQPMTPQPVTPQPMSPQPMSFQPTTPLTAQPQPNSPQSNQPGQPNPTTTGQGAAGQGASSQSGQPQGAAGPTQSVAAQPMAGQTTAALPSTATPMAGSPATTLSGSTQPGAAQPSPTANSGANSSGSQPAGADERNRNDDRTDRDERPAGRPASDPPTGVVVKRLVVGPFDPKWEQVAEVRQFSSLSEAVRATIELPEVDTIELHYDGERISEPLDVSPPSRRLTIRAGA
ncbi:MAG TPA: protein kinase, partial [Pirellulaceae bacterium]|nr:protein kinase [Pirellulaceae bacterium]